MTTSRHDEIKTPSSPQQRKRPQSHPRCPGASSNGSNGKKRQQKQTTQAQLKKVQPGMIVEGQNDALGKDDLSKPKVSSVKRDAQGRVSQIEVKKGVVFRKTIEIAPERVQAVQKPDKAAPEGKVKVEATDREVAALSATGTEALAPEKTHVPHEKLKELHKRQHSAAITQPAEITAQKDEEEAREEAEETKRSRSARQVSPTTSGKRANGFITMLRMLGPGFLSGMAGNDSSAVASYAIDGATAGYGHLWLIVLSTPLLQAVQVACGQIGRVTKQGLNTLLREHYGRKVSIPATMILLVANTGLIAANLVAIGEGFQLLTGIKWVWFVAPVALILWYITTYQNFSAIKNIFLVMSLAFAAYIITGFFSGAHWGQVLLNTVTPQVTFSFASVSSAVALLGATISPYTMFWQAEGEKEAHRPGPLTRQLKLSRRDIGAGVFSGNLVAYFIIVCAAATLHTHHQQIATAADAARALQPLLGPYATYLFAIGFIGAGLVAIPVLLAGSSYAVANVFGWPASLWRKPWQSEGFYLILGVALVIGLIIALIGIDPISLIFYANVLQGALAPVLVTLLIFLGTNRKVMGEHRLSHLIIIGLVLAAVLMFAATILLFYGMFTGQGG